MHLIRPIRLVLRRSLCVVVGKREKLFSENMNNYIV